jgi:uncharacterized RmlC-like cupin family protein
MEQGSVRVVRGSETPTQRSDRTTSNDTLGPDNGSPDLAVVSYSCAPGFRTGVHHHTADSLALITAGRALFRWGRDLQEEVELGPGDWLYVGAGEIHEELTPDDTRAEMVVILNRGGGESVFK